jgi:hypothetical protein
MKTIPSCSFALLVAVLLAGCGGAETEADPSRDAIGDAGVLHFHVEADAPLSQGANDLRISIDEMSTHMPLTGASVDLSAIMPAMAHDAPQATTTEEIDGGTYIAHDLALPMAGRWYVDVKASREGTVDTVRFTYDIR